MSSSTENSAASPWFPRFGVWMLGAAITLALAIGYWALVRTTYVPILSNVEPQDAADIVKTLEEQKVPYQLADDGRTILVDSAVADKARIELIGSDLPLHGQVGFELFNKSDMGLTEFDQKINYQRALQGELARTILMLDGIKSVRVHLGLPDQGLFRNDQQHPKASVTVILKPGMALTEQRVQGIQRLVAGGIPDMATDAVAVLDGTGRVISGNDAQGSPVATAGDRNLEAFRGRIDQALHAALPDMLFSLTVSYRSGQSAMPAQSAPTATGSGNSIAEPDTAPATGYNVRLTTSQPLDSTTRTTVSRVIGDQGFDAAHGDRLAFLVGPVLAAGALALPGSNDRVVTRRAPLPVGDSHVAWLAYWPWALVGAVILLVLAFASDRYRARQRSAAGLAGFADELRARLDAEDRSV
ncbi:flagellar basal-body MS-ring/collar protein FliF [Telmatospirillum sp.]|uniref:flagellar basal-body MS-ring/collar protein FliF n=1 Tax=Telmatospirillum sp. TaxID=2079197 RepID=UPI002840A015|nr:flagellar basal-body MS-ring/collar protein FliF [Telmatospirillum sp.]MDR3438091.1 flagellar basal-body MS-ring/collar protein FliF [Telmatospirillum sp.]